MSDSRYSAQTAATICVLNEEGAFEMLTGLQGYPYVLFGGIRSIAFKEMIAVPHRAERDGYGINHSARAICFRPRRY